MTETELKAKLEKYLAKAKPLFEDVEVSGAGSFDTRTAAEKIKEMALSYYKDALHFHQKGEDVNALAALEYAEGWLDAGRYTGLIKDRRQ